MVSQKHIEENIILFFQYGARKNKLRVKGDSVYKKLFHLQTGHEIGNIYIYIYKECTFLLTKLLLSSVVTKCKRETKPVLHSS